MIDIEERLAAPGVVILDGAVTTELERRGVPMSQHNWGGSTTLTHPEAVRQLHEDYIRAGADVITTNTYSSAPHHLAAAGIEDRTEEVNARSVQLAREARDAVAEGDVWVAGSMSLQAPNLRPKDRPPVNVHNDNLRRQAAYLAEAGADLLVLEMLRDVDYSTGAVEAALSTGLPVWASFSMVVEPDGRVITHHQVGEQMPLEESLQGVLGRGECLVGIMHTELCDTARGIEVAHDYTQATLGAWPNNGHFSRPNWIIDDSISPDVLADAAEKWVSMGAKVVGGCCGFGPDHIRALAERFKR